MWEMRAYCLGLGANAELMLTWTVRRLLSTLRAEEQAARDSGVQGVPLIRYEGALVSEGAAPEEMLAARLQELAGI